MNFMPAEQIRNFLRMRIWMVYMIEYRFECRNEFHASSRFAVFMYGLMDGVSDRI